MKRTFFIVFALFCMAGVGFTQNTISVADTNVPQNDAEVLT